MAFGRECLQSMVVGVGDDDSAALVVDTGAVELARLVALVSELEQGTRAIERCEYL